MSVMRNQAPASFTIQEAHVDPYGWPSRAQVDPHGGVPSTYTLVLVGFEFSQGFQSVCVDHCASASVTRFFFCSDPPPPPWLYATIESEAYQTPSLSRSQRSGGFEAEW